MTDLQTRIQQRIKELEPETVANRRHIHELAELSNTEVDTSAFVEGKLREYGFEDIHRPTEFSVVAILDTGREGKKLALRADIDALAVPESEENLAGPRVCRSRTPDKTCHACGHDAHSAMLLTAAKVLLEVKEELCGTLYICFEQGEERGGIGSVGIIKWLKERGGVDSVWAIHVLNYIESGKLCVDPGPRMAGAVEVNTIVHGRSGHGSRPDQSINPVYCAANILTNMATAQVNRINVEETVTMGFTSIEGGGGSGNIIPETAHIAGSFRFFNREEGVKSAELYEKVAKDVADIHGCTVEFAGRSGVVVWPCINDEKLSALAKEAIEEVTPEGTVVSAPKWYASEAFSRYLEAFGGVFCHLGIKNEAYGSGAPHHNTLFDIDEGVLSRGVTDSGAYAMKLCGK